MLPTTILDNCAYKSVYKQMKDYIDVDFLKMPKINFFLSINTSYKFCITK